MKGFITGWDYIMDSACDTYDDYYADIIVFYTEECVLWNLGNVIHAMGLDESFKVLPTDGVEHGYTFAPEVAPVKIPGYQNMWVKWPVFKQLLDCWNPYADNRLTWWCGQEVGMKR